MSRVRVMGHLFCLVLVAPYALALALDAGSSSTFTDGSELISSRIETDLELGVRFIGEPVEAPSILVWTNKDQGDGNKSRLTSSNSKPTK